MREIITIQLGADANFVGSHFWNAQEAYFSDYSTDPEDQSGSGLVGASKRSCAAGFDLVDHSIHFRAGIGADGSDTFLPRALVYDAKYQFGALRKETALYNLIEQDGQQQMASTAGQFWSGQTETVTDPAIEPSEYTAALDAPDRFETSAQRRSTIDDRSIRFWSDYLHTFYHPRSLFPLPLDRAAGSIGPSFRTAAGPGPTSGSRNSAGRAALDLDYADGDDIWRLIDSEQDGDGWENGDLRRLIEESDSVQGIQMMANVAGPWGNVAAGMTDRIRDDLPKTDIWVWAIEGGSAQTRTQRMKRSVNLAQSMSGIMASASLYLPLRTDEAARWAGLADPATGEATAWRMGAWQAIAIESALLPARLAGPAGSSMHSIRLALNLTGGRKMVAMSQQVRLAGSNPDVVADYDFFDSTVPASPTGRTGGKKPRVREFDSVELDRGDCWDDDGRQAPRDGEDSRTRRFKSPLLFPLVESFPDIFPVQSGATGVAVRTRLATSSRVADRIAGLSTAVSRSAGSLFGLSERENLAAGLEDLREEYVEGWESASDDDDDY